MAVFGRVALNHFFQKNDPSNAFGREMLVIIGNIIPVLVEYIYVSNSGNIAIHTVQDPRGFPCVSARAW